MILSKIKYPNYFYSKSLFTLETTASASLRIACFYRFFPSTKQNNNIQEKAWHELFIVSLFLLPIFTVFIAYQDNLYSLKSTLSAQVKTETCCFLILNRSCDVDTPARPSTPEG